MATIKKSPLELFITSFVKQKNRMKVPLVYIDKAIVLIEQKIESSCCDIEDAVVDLHTYRDNLLTRTVKMYLNTMTRDSANLKSLARTKIKLQIFKDKCEYCA